MSTKMNYYVKFGEQMLTFHQENSHWTEWSDLVAWLADAPTNAPKNAILTWTGLMQASIDQYSELEAKAPETMANLQHYLDYLPTLNADEMVQLMTALEFKQCMDALGGTKTKPPCDTFVALLQSGWSPAPLLSHMLFALPRVLAIQETKQGYPEHMESSTMGTLVKAIQSMMLNKVWQQKVWTPEAHPVYTVLYDTFVVAEVGGTEKEVSFIRRLSKVALHGAPDALAWASLQEYIRPVHFEALLPLALEKGRAPELLENTLSLVLNEPDHLKGKTLGLMAKHHPEFASLISMHCSLFPESTPMNTNWEVSLPGYMALLGEAGPAPYESLDHTVFEE